MKNISEKSNNYSKYFYIKDKEILSGYISKHSSTSGKQIILLIILNEEKEGQHYLAVKKLSALLHAITSKHKGREASSWKILENPGKRNLSWEALEKHKF